MGDYKNLCKATYFSAIFLLMYIPFAIVNNLFSEVNEANGYGNLGFILLGLLYVGNIFGAIVGAAVLKKIGRNNQIVLSILLMSVIAFAQMLPLLSGIKEHKSAVSAALIVCTLLSGFGVANLWIA